ncbi:TIGR03617 family F420-dependent LLM class oxidoreductase [Caenimonas sp. SL110]|uniref:TIGR03617 family F420-dependent LLM class oxidoreductase n=1 Tax=Caenimonas sp. SL110 TaxID=1450524 RepID=UPI00065359A7|nr:TIGR03617 family F420-dependent LLM class oxidoreductase [Caenimonas sp. SL110]
MKLETLLPLGKVDPGLRAPEKALEIAKVASDAKIVEELGYDSLMVEETKDDPFIVMALAAQATTTLQLGTAVAIAFPRSPTITAMSAWTLSRLSGGRFTLGLGTQVKGHIERRYGMPWHPAGPWIREYISAVRAIWDCWQNGTALDIRGEHYNINLMVPLFNPGPIDFPVIPIHLAAVNTVLCQVAGEVADGIRPHPVCSAEYIEKVMLPSVREGAAKSGRDLKDFKVSIKPLIATAPDEEQLQKKIVDVRARVAFYASTPAYAAAFEFHGLGDLASRLKILSKEQRWEEMPAFIDDDVLNLFATVGTFDVIGDKLIARYGKVATNAEFSIPISSEADMDTLRGLIRKIHAA